MHSFTVAYVVFSDKELSVNKIVRMVQLPHRLYSSNLSQILEECFEVRPGEFFSFQVKDCIILCLLFVCFPFLLVNNVHVLFLCHNSVNFIAYLFLCVLISAEFVGDVHIQVSGC